MGDLSLKSQPKELIIKQHLKYFALTQYSRKPHHNIFVQPENTPDMSLGYMPKSTSESMLVWSMYYKKHSKSEFDTITSY